SERCHVGEVSQLVGGPEVKQRANYRARCCPLERSKLTRFDPRVFFGARDLDEDRRSPSSDPKVPGCICIREANLLEHLTRPRGQEGRDRHDRVVSGYLRRAATRPTVRRRPEPPELAGERICVAGVEALLRLDGQPCGVPVWG